MVRMGPRPHPGTVRMGPRPHSGTMGPRPHSGPSRHELGRHAERAVADYLFARGYTILAQNLRLGALEIDLVARRGPLVVMCEVRVRGDGALERPFASIAGVKRMRLLRAADRLWRRKLAAMRDVERMRIDVAAVRFDGGKTFVEYVEGAISASPAAL